MEKSYKLDIENFETVYHVTDAVYVAYCWKQCHFDVCNRSQLITDFNNFTEAWEFAEKYVENLNGK